MQVVDKDHLYLECLFFDDNANAHVCKFKEKSLTGIRKKNFLSAMSLKEDTD